MGLDNILSADILSHLKYRGNSALAQRYRFLYCDKKSGKSRHKHAWNSSAFCFPSVVRVLCECVNVKADSNKIISGLDHLMGKEELMKKGEKKKEIVWYLCGQTLESALDS